MTNTNKVVQSIRKVLNEVYSPLSKDRQIHDLISLEDKKELYNLVVSGDMETLKSKMFSISKEVTDIIGIENRFYVKDYIKRMVGKMILTYKK